MVEADSFREVQPDSNAQANKFIGEALDERAKALGLRPQLDPGMGNLPSLSISDYFEKGKVYVDTDRAISASFSAHGDSLVVKGNLTFKDNQGQKFNYPYNLTTDGKDSDGSFIQQWQSRGVKIDCSYPMKMRILDAETVQVYMPSTLFNKINGPLRCPDYSSFYGWTVKELHPLKTKK